MREYKTQMEAARRGIITPEMKKVAAKEYRTEEEIRELVAKGQVAICANRLHTCIEPNGVGSMLRTKINVNLFFGHRQPSLNISCDFCISCDSRISFCRMCCDCRIS